MKSLQRWLAKAVPATPQERAAALWSFGYFFTLLAGYYVLRPLRDQMGIAGGVKALPWMFTATFVTLLVAQPLYGALVSRVTRARFIPVVYHFFVANLALFWLLLTADVATYSSFPTRLPWRRSAYAYGAPLTHDTCMWSRSSRVSNDRVSISRAGWGL